MSDVEVLTHLSTGIIRADEVAVAGPVVLAGDGQPVVLIELDPVWNEDAGTVTDVYIRLTAGGFAQAGVEGLIVALKNVIEILESGELEEDE